MREDMRDSNRLVSLLNQAVRQTNERVIDPMIPKLTLDSIAPAIEVTAEVRGAYLRTFLDIAKASRTSGVTDEQIAKLAKLRKAYDELSHGFQALEAAIERGYLNVKT
ncbi:MAG: hypothetical protein ACPGO3_02140 [Magnetospiraceae bacterium]